MTFEEWWAEKGCRVECQTHEERARQAWYANHSLWQDSFLKASDGNTAQLEIMDNDERY